MPKTLFLIIKIFIHHGLIHLDSLNWNNFPLYNLMLLSALKIYSCSLLRKQAKNWWLMVRHTIFLSYQMLSRMRISLPLIASQQVANHVSWQRCIHDSSMKGRDLSFVHIHIPDIYSLSGAKCDFRHIPGQAELHTVVIVSRHRAAHSQGCCNFLPFLCGCAGVLRRVEPSVGHEVTPQSTTGSLWAKRCLVTDLSVRLK